MQYARPKPLKPGDLVALISPSGPLASPEIADQCREAIEQLGYKVILGDSAARRMDYLAGTDEERVADLNKAIRDPEVRAILCTRGGYGSGRLLRDIDYAAFKANPKIFGGFSDISSLHGALMAQCETAVLHTATIASALVYEKQKLTPQARAAFIKSISTTEPIGSIREAMSWNDALPYRKGRATGILVGGNASNVAALLGTPYLPPPEGKILFLEDVGEEPYKIDRYINHLDMSGYLSRTNGLILGQFTDAEPTDSKREKIDVVLPRLVKHLNIPVIANFPSGHVPHNVPLPFGCRVEMDVDAGDVIFQEAYCVD